MNNAKLGLNLDLKSGHPALEFTNTVNDHASQNPGETLFQYEDLLTWGMRAGLLPGEQVENLRHKAEARPREAAVVFAQALELREALYRILVAKTEKNPPADEDLMVLNSLLRDLTRGAQVMPQEDRFVWQWDFDPEFVKGPLAMIALSAVDLMTSEHYQRVGQCADVDGCGWLFVDTSKNHSRRWCDINDCGNRAKQRRYQKRAHRQKS